MTCACDYENGKVLGLCGAHHAAYRELFAIERSREVKAVVCDMESHVRVLKAPPEERLPYEIIEKWIGALS